MNKDDFNLLIENEKKKIGNMPGNIKNGIELIGKSIAILTSEFGEWILKIFNDDSSKEKQFGKLILSTHVTILCLNCTDDVDSALYLLDDIYKKARKNICRVDKTINMGGKKE